MSADERAIRDLIATWAQASADGDLERLQTLMADDAVFLTPGQPPMSRDAFLAAFAAMHGQVRLASSHDVREVQASSDLAYAWAHLTVTVTVVASGEVRRRSGPTLTVFRKDADGRWRLARDANMLTFES